MIEIKRANQNIIETIPYSHQRIFEIPHYTLSKEGDQSVILSSFIRTYYIKVNEKFLVPRK